MYLAGHTLGTPDTDLEGASAVFASAGLSAAELIYQDAYRAGIPEADFKSAARARSSAASLGIAIAAITPYMTGLNSPDVDVRLRDVSRFKTAIEIAHELGGPSYPSPTPQYPTCCETWDTCTA
jgi:sugar phosphate isomerase/epimerase